MTGLLDGAVTDLVLDELRTERARQDEKWGEQNHRDGTGPFQLPLAIFDSLMAAPELADAARAYTDAALDEGLVTFLDILREEVFEAFAERDPARLRRELIEVAAVAVQWVEAIDRRERGEVASS